MATRTITGVMHYPNGDPWVGARVRFVMVSGAYTVSPAVTYPQASMVAITDSDGALAVTLTSGLGIWWDCLLPDGDGFRFALDDGSTVTLEQLRADAIGDPVPISYPSSDIVITSAARGQMLAHNGAQFVNRANEVANVRDFGALGDGVTDDTDAIERAIATGLVVFFPAGDYVLSATQAATTHTRIQGAGLGNIASGTVTPITSITWGGGAAKMFTSDAKTNSWSFSDIHLDGNDTATHGVHVKEMHDQRWGPTSIWGCTTRALLLEGDTTGNVAFNVFEKLILHSHTTGTTALELKGNNTGNVCHNHFGHLYVGFAGTDAGIVWGDSDNNEVMILAVGRGSGTGYGLDLTSSAGGGAARANYFYHVEMPGGGDVHPMVARTGTRNTINNYDRENGQLAPVLEGTAVLRYTSDIYGINHRSLTLTNDDATTTILNLSGTGGNQIGGDIALTGDLVATKATPLLSVKTLDATTAATVEWYVASSHIWDMQTEVATGDLLVKLQGGQEALRFTRSGGTTVTAVKLPVAPLALKDGITAPSTVTGYAQIYVDTADGDLKVKYGDGTVKTIVVDT